MRTVTATLFLLGSLVSTPALGQECSQTIEGNDQMQFNLKEMRVSADCGTVTVTLKHVGQLPVNAMGHNFVLAATDDYRPLAMAAQQAFGEATRGGGAPKYLPDDDARVLAASDMIGGGEETSLTIDLSGLQAGGDYTFFCSFPAHYVLMSGKFIIE